ncbi:MAG: hypothetical protein HZB38_08605 [Planctomycetes bacterium]|nr:hypothetical protein [Planctomycetota bacterium]
MKNLPRIIPIMFVVVGLGLLLTTGCQSADRAEPAALTGDSEPAAKDTKQTKLSSHRVGRGQQIQHRAN